MSIFCYKPLAPSRRLGTTFLEKRRERGLTLADIAEATHIQIKYLAAIEQGNFSVLPRSPAFRHAYIREYAVVLGLDPADALAQFKREDDLDAPPRSLAQKKPKQFPLVAISMIGRNILLAGCVILFISYLAGQVTRLAAPPRLAIYAPVEGAVINNLSTIIEGETEKESRLTVNGHAAMVNEQGKFSTKIDLAYGLNTVTITATKKHGKTTSIARHIIVSPASLIQAVSLK